MEEEAVKQLGRHLLAELTDCEREPLDDPEALAALLREAVHRSGATLISSVSHQYAPHGVSLVVLIAESHFSLHTWPEYGYAAADFFTCGTEIDPVRACDYLGRALGAKVHRREVPRGIPAAHHERLPHKGEAR
jgi:S-adenosylmethionine decarboxylase